MRIKACLFPITPFFLEILGVSYQVQDNKKILLYLKATELFYSFNPQVQKQIVKSES